MKDLQREILSQVAAGKITAEEAATRLESLDSAESARQAEPAPAATPALPASAAAPETRRIKVISRMGSAEIVGDPSVAFVVAEGAHRARQEGDTMVIEHAALEENNQFIFSRGERRAAIEGHQRRLLVRMNPELALFVSTQAGNVRIEGVHGPLNGEVQAANCTISGFRSPLNMVIQAGNLSASGMLDSGESKIRCDMGSVRINLEKGSSVRVSARATMGKVAIESPGTEAGSGQGGKDVIVGSGKATMDIECTMGTVRVSAD